MPIFRACRSSTPCEISSAPAANSPLAAPLKNRNVGRDSSCGILLQQPLVARLEGRQVVALLVGQLLEDAPAAHVLRRSRGARVELEAAALGGDRNPDRIAREHHLAGRRLGPRRLPGAALLARPVDLQHALPRGEPARRRDLLDQPLDVGAQELGRAVAALADEVEVPGMPERVLEAEPALAEVHLARDAGVHHPLQRAVDGGAADARVFAVDERHQVVGAQVPFVLEEDAEDALPLGGASPACGMQAGNVGNDGLGVGRHQGVVP